MPDDFISFAIEWLQTKGKQVQAGAPVSGHGVTGISISQNANEGKKDKKDKKRKASASSEEASEDDDDFDEEEMKRQAAKVAKLKNAGQRNSVSAEVYGSFNKKEDYKAKVVPKSEEQKKRI